MNEGGLYVFGDEWQYLRRIELPADADPISLLPVGDVVWVSDWDNDVIRRFSAAGEHLHSWGEYGTDPGQFNLVHSIATDADGRVYVADRENHRVQLFDGEGTFLEQWNNMHRPCGLHVHEDRLPPIVADYQGGFQEILEQQRQRAESGLAQQAADLGHDVESVIVDGVPHLEIVRFAEERGVDLIVMATHGRGFFSHAIMGSTTERVVRRAPCAVLSVRGE